jgi:amino acid transporter
MNQTTVSGGKGLKAGAIGLLESVVIGMAATAPAYTMAATLGFVVIAVGLQAPGILLLAFVPMICIAVAFQQLNRVDPDCGTTFTWAGRIFGPRTGWLGGWVMTFSAIIAMAYLAGIAASYLYLLFGAEGLAASTSWVALAGAAIVAIMTWVCYRGIVLSARVQQVLLAIELVMLLLFAIVALVKAATGNAPPEGGVAVSASWFNPFAAGSAGVVVAGLLTAVFAYWGWDSAVSVNEETRERRRNPGLAAVIAMALLLGTFLLTTVAALAYAGAGTEGIGLASEDTAIDVLAVVGAAVLGGGILSKLLILAVLSSAVAALQTGILPAARTTLSMATFGALPRSFARIHPRFQSPSFGTIVVGGVTVLLFLVLGALTQGRVAGDAILAIGLLITFYYPLVGFTCVWRFRRELTRSTRDLLLKGILPGVGSLVLLFVFFRSAWDMRAPDYGTTSFGGVGGVFLLGIGTIVLGVLAMLVWNAVRPEFFRSRLPAATDSEPEAEPPPLSSSAPAT